jgi:AraC-like DNA-binding protein
MTITISHQAFWELFVEAEQDPQHINSSKQFDRIWKLSQQLGQGAICKMQLRPGLYFLIWDYQLHDDLVVHIPERDSTTYVEFGFSLSGNFQDKYSLMTAGDNFLFGSGIGPKETWQWTAQPRFIAVSFLIDIELFQSFWRDLSEFPSQLRQLVRTANREYFLRTSRTTAAMQVALQQLLKCPYTSMTKRMFVESKAIELMSLLIEQMLEEQRGQCSSHSLKPDDINRIYRAKEILLQCLDNPPSLKELAQQVGLNDCMLKRGFRLVFGTTAFGYLHERRLEQARRLQKREQSPRLLSVGCSVSGFNRRQSLP